MTKSNFKIVALNHINETWDEDGRRYLIEAHVEIQCEDRVGGEAFRVFIASPAQLVSELEGKSEIEPGRGYLFLNQYDERIVVSWLQRFVDRCKATSWEALKNSVDRYFDWIE